MATELQVPEEITQRLGEIAATVLAEVEIADTFVVDDEASAKLAGDQLQAISRLVSSLNEERLGYTRPYDQIKATIKGAYDDPVDKLNAASVALRKRLTEYLQEQQRKADEALRQERQRIAREQEEARQKLEAEQARAASLKTDAAKARAADRIEDAAAKVVEAESTTAIAPAAPKVAGFSLRDNWIPEYANDSLETLVKAIAGVDALKNPKLLRYVTFEVVEINRVVKALRDGADIPGVKPVNRPISSVRK